MLALPLRASPKSLDAKGFFGQQFPEQGLLATRGGAVGEELGEYRYVWPTEVPRNTG